MRNRRNEQPESLVADDTDNEQQEGGSNWGCVKIALIFILVLFAGSVLVYMLSSVVAQNNSRPSLPQISMDEVVENPNKYTESAEGHYDILCTQDSEIHSTIKCSGPKEGCEDIAKKMRPICEVMRRKDDPKADPEGFVCKMMGKKDYPVVAQNNVRSSLNLGCGRELDECTPGHCILCVSYFEGSEDIEAYIKIECSKSNEKCEDAIKNMELIREVMRKAGHPSADSKSLRCKVVIDKDDPDLKKMKDFCKKMREKVGRRASFRGS